MHNLIIEGTNKIPEVKFESSTGILSLSGRCVPENPIELFRPLFEWIKEYENSPQEETIVEIFLDYFNTASSKCLLDFLKRLEATHLKERSMVKVIWKYEEEDETMLEEGKDFSSLIDIPFEIIEDYI